MKRYLIYAFAFYAMFCSGCKKYLGIPPDQRTKLNTPEKVSELLVTAYPSGNYVMVAEAMSDNLLFVSITGDDLPENRDAYLWKDVQGRWKDTPDYYWNSCYEAIAAANQALATIASAPDPWNYAHQKGEALVARAYAQFMLVTFYAKCYDPETASTDVGIPYVMEPENVVIKQYDRKTVAYVYEQIEKDLLEGIPLIQDWKYSVPAYHFTKKAAYAFATRYYLFKKDYDKVIAYANLAFPANDFAKNVRPWLSYQNLSGGSREIKRKISSADNPGNILLTETSSWVARNLYTSIYAMSQDKLNAIIMPLGVKFSAYKIYSYSSTFYFVPKHYEHFRRSSINANTGFGYVMQTLFCTEEVLLNRAEAEIMKGDYNKALADMNTLIGQRVSSYSPAQHNFTETKIMDFYSLKTTQKRQAYIYALLDLKRAEFVEEGMRWMDILRHKMPIERLDKNGKTIKLAANDLRKVWQLPKETALSGVSQNPR